MIQYRGNVIGNEIGRPSRFVTCNFSTRVPRADNEGKNIAAAFDERRDIFVSDNIKLCIPEVPQGLSFLKPRRSMYDRRSLAAREIIISMNRYGYAFILISDIKKFPIAFCEVFRSGRRLSRERLGDGEREKKYGIYWR